MCHLESATLKQTLGSSCDMKERNVISTLQKYLILCSIQIFHLTAFSIQQLRLLSFCTLDIGTWLTTGATKCHNGMTH